MWRKICSSREPWYSIGKLLIIPALFGLVIAPTVVFWIPAGTWPNIITVSFGFIALGFIALFMALGIIQRFRTHSEVDIEDALSTLGLFLAFVVGIFMFGLNPAKWEDRARENRENVTEQAGHGDAEPAS